MMVAACVSPATPAATPEATSITSVVTLAPPTLEPARTRSAPRPTATPPVQIEHGSANPQVSGDGALVAYQTNDLQLLDPNAPRCGDGQPCWQILRYNLRDGSTNPVSVSAADGAWAHGDIRLNAGAIDGLGERVVFTADLNAPAQGTADGTSLPTLYWRDFSSDELRRLPASAGRTGLASISENADWIVFEASGPLQAGEPERQNIYAFQISTQTLHLASRPERTDIAVGGQNLLGSISANGRWVAFWSFVNLTSDDSACANAHEGGNRCGDVFIYDTTDGSMQRVAIGEVDAIGNTLSRPVVSDSGRYMWLDPWIFELHTGVRTNVRDLALRACALTFSAFTETFTYLDPVDRFAHRFDPATGIDQAVVQVAGRSDGGADLDLSGCGGTGTASQYQFSDDLMTIVFVSTRAEDVADTVVCPSISPESGSCPDVYLWRIAQPDVIWVSRPGPSLGSPIPTMTPAPTIDFNWANTQIAGERLPTPEAIRPGDIAQARETLHRFLSLLAEGDFAAAAPLYGGSAVGMWESLGKWLALDDRVGLLTRICDGGFLQCLPVRAITDGAPTATTFEFVVEFSNPDGSLFVRGPCCGSNETDMPPVSGFPMSVIWAEGRYWVLGLPPYVP